MSTLPPKADIAGNNSGSLPVIAAIRRVFPPKTRDTRSVRLASSKIAEFGKYDSLVVLGIPAGVFSFDAQRMPSRKDGTRVGDEGKAAGIAQAPAALLSQHNVMIRSVITITESRSFVIPASVMIEPPSPRVVPAKLGGRCLLCAKSGHWRDREVAPGLKRITRGGLRRLKPLPESSSNGAVRQSIKGDAMDAQALIIWLIVGGVAGWLAGMVVKGGGYGLIGDIIVGIIGGLIAGWLLPQLGIVIGTGIIAAIIDAFIGAVILLLLLRLAKRAA
jgi:uncharacterized membrane protein YeaQ/YmgE (transglycosylase-associated protein family)